MWLHVQISIEIAPEIGKVAQKLLLQLDEAPQSQGRIDWNGAFAGNWL